MRSDPDIVSTRKKRAEEKKRKLERKKADVKDLYSDII
jgi:hypothetical protein